MVILMGVLWVLIVKYFFLRFGDFLLWFQIFFTPLASDSYPPFFLESPTSCMSSTVLPNCVPCELNTD